MGNALSNDRIQYAVSVAPPPYAGCTPVYRCAGYPAGLVSELPGVPWDSPWDIFQYRASMPGFRAKQFLGSRLWDSNRQETVPCSDYAQRQPKNDVSWLTYGEVEELARSLARGLVAGHYVDVTQFPHERYPPARELRFLGVISKNRPEWFVTELAACAAGCTLVPLYDSLGEEALLHILKETQMKAIACSGESFLELVRILGKYLSDGLLRTFILFDRPSDKCKTMASEFGLTLLYWKDVVDEGRKSDMIQLPYQKREEVGTLCYTSGTTGAPKGVIITSGNYSSVVAGHQRCIMAHPGFHTDHSDIHISYLPLAHVFERLICANCFALGVRIVCYSGDTQKLLDDMKVIKPTVFLSVPRLYMRINDKVFSSLQDKSSVAKFLFETAMQAKLKNLREHGIYTHPLWDNLVFGKIRKLMGGNVKFMLVGGAPLEAIVQERMSVLFCCPLLHGFGMTEMGASFICNPGDKVAGHIGGVQPFLEFSLKSVPEMGYYADGTKEEVCGELIVRGPAVTPGYLMHPEATDDTITAEKWLKSGDVAVLLEGNAIRIIDRKKNIFKMAQGEYVAPDRIEAVYAQAELVSQCMVHGDSTKSQLVAMVVPDEEAAARGWSEDRSMEPLGSSVKELCQRQDFKKAVMAGMDEIAKQNNLKGFEKVKNIYLIPEPFSVENDLLTPTLKLKRHVARQRFANEIALMYKDLE